MSSNLGRRRFFCKIKRSVLENEMFEVFPENEVFSENEVLGGNEVLGVISEVSLQIIQFSTKYG